MNPAIPVHVDGLIYAKQPHGGISRNFTNLLNAFATTGAASTCLYLEPGVHRPADLLPVQVRTLPQAPRLRPSRVFGRLGDSIGRRRERHFWRGLDGGVFHSSYYSTPEGLRIPQVLTLQDTIYEDFPELFDTPRHHAHVADKKRAVSSAAGFIFSSQDARQAAQRHYELDGRPTLVAPYAVDPGLLREPNDRALSEYARLVAGGRPFLLHVGSRYLHKNVARLLEAWAGWRGRGEFALLLAGGGELGPDEIEHIQRLGLRESIVVRPRVTESDLLLAYHAAHGFVFPSLSEGFGFPLLEALACGCPSAAAQAASLPEVGGDAPYFFDPTDCDAIRGGLDFLASCDRADLRWQRAGIRARSRSWTDVAGEYGRFYEAVAASAAHGS